MFDGLPAVRFGAYQLVWVPEEDRLHRDSRDEGPCNHDRRLRACSLCEHKLYNRDKHFIKNDTPTMNGLRVDI